MNHPIPESIQLNLEYAFFLSHSLSLNVRVNRDQFYPLEDAEDDIAEDDLGSGEASLKTQRHSSSHSDSLMVRPHCEF